MITPTSVNLEVIIAAIREVAEYFLGPHGWGYHRLHILRADVLAVDIGPVQTGYIRIMPPTAEMELFLDGLTGIQYRMGIAISTNWRPENYFDGAFMLNTFISR